MGAVLAESDGRFRRWEYTSPGGETTYTIDYGGGKARTGSVAVNGEVVAVNFGKSRSERYAFELGKIPAALEVKSDMMMRIKSLKLVAGGSTAYREGEAATETSMQDVEALQAGPRLPKQVQVERTPGAVEIRYRERASTGVGLTLMGLFVVAAGVFFYSILEGFPFWLIGMWVLIGLGVLYLGVSKLVNRTTIHLDRQELSLRRGPLPSLGRKPANQPARQIQGFSSLLTVRRNDDNNTRTQLYILIARMQNGEQVDLLIDRSQAVIVAMRNSLAKFQDEAV